MKKLTALFFSVLFSVVAWSAPANEGTHVVALFENQSPEVVARFHGVGRIRTWHRFLNGRWGALSGFSCSPNANQLARLAQDTRVFVVESNVTVTALSQTLPTGVRRIGCTNNALWLASTTTPINVDVAVLDTGIDLTHPDLNVWQNVSFVGTATGNDDNGHGSHCAGIIGAQNNGIGVVGVAPGCRLWAVKVLDSTGSGSLSQIISGVDYVTGHSSEIEVASMSLGGQGTSDSLRLAIQNSVARGIVYVVAAGNSNGEVYGADKVLGTYDDFFPGCYPEVMTVSAMADSDGIPGGAGPTTSYGADDTTATFSNWSTCVDASNPVFSPGKAIDVAAPGVSIYSTYKNGGYATMSGTSMACPHVAGAVALYIAANARATDAAGVYAIRQAIVNYSQANAPMPSWGKTVPNGNWWFFDCYNEPLVWVGTAVTLPNVTITTPSVITRGAATFETTDVIAFSGTTDSSTLQWYDSVLGLIGTGNFSRTLPPGDHRITACSTNAITGVFNAADNYIAVMPPPSATAPALTITAPASGSTYASTDPITFSCTCVDAIDGNIAAKVAWSSALNGPIGTGASFVGYLSPGAQVVSAYATNTSGLTTNKSISLTITGTTPVGHPPVVSITSPSSGASYPQGSTVPIYATASDTEDGDLSSAIQWNGPSGLFAIGSNASTNGLPVGVDTITASVQDSSGAVATASRTVTITGAGTPLTVTVTTDKANYSNKMKALITVTVRSGGVAVSGATVTVNVRGASGKTSTKTGLTTSAAGTASYYFNINRGQLGAGTATVSANASAVGHVAGTGSTTFVVN